MSKDKQINVLTLLTLNKKLLIVFHSQVNFFISFFGFSEKSVQKESEVEAEQIEEGTVEKGQDHDPGEKVNRVGLDKVSCQLKIQIKLPYIFFT